MRYLNKKISTRLILLLTFVIINTHAHAESSQVWANSSSKVYHCEGTRWYGKTKKGFYANEVDVINQGYRASHNSRCSRAGLQETKKIATMEGATIKVWLNTGSKVYHCPGARYYGNTKRGWYLTQADALAVGGRPSNGLRCK